METVSHRAAALTCRAWLGHDGRHRNGLNDGGGAWLGGGSGGDAADPQNGGLAPSTTGLRGGDDGSGLAVC